MSGYRRLSRTALVGALRRASVVIGATLAITGWAAAGDGWDGSWHGGFDHGGDGVQIDMIGSRVTGFYFHFDYLDTDSGAAAADGTVTFHWDGGEGTLADDGGKRRLTIHETGKAERVIPLERDN
jgi:hypothetical protein